MEIDSKPEAMDRLDRRMIQLKIEREAVKKESDEASRRRLDLIEAEIKKLEREYADLEEVWKSEKAAVQGTQHIKEEIDKLRLQMEDLKRKGQYDKLAEIQYGKLPQLEAQLKQAEKAEVAQGQAQAAAHSGRRRRDRRSGVARDRNPGQQDDAGRAREAAEAWRSFCTSVSSARMKRCASSPMRSAARAPGLPIRIVHMVRSCSSARPASARPS